MKIRWVVNSEDKRVLQIKYEGRRSWSNVPVIRAENVGKNDEKPKFDDNYHFISIEMNR
jgi:hypothetical protein